MRLQLGKAAGALARAVAADARHRQPGVVVENGLRHATEEGEGCVVPVTEGLEPLSRIGLDEARVRVRQVEAEEVDLPLHPANHRHRFPEVGLRVARRVHQRHEHLPDRRAPLANVVLHGGVAAGEAVLGAEPVVDPLGRVPLLDRRRAVLLQDPVDHRGERPQPGACRWTPPSVARRHREGQHLADRVAVNAKAPGRLPDAQPLDMAGVANPSVELH